MGEGKAMISIDDWKPISTAPSGETILLAWDDGGDDYDFLFSEGELHDGVWLDGRMQPDWWMYCPAPPSKRRLTADNFRVLATLPEDPAHARSGSMLTGMRNPERHGVSDLLALPWAIAAFFFRDLPWLVAQSFMAGFEGLPTDDDDPASLRILNPILRAGALFAGMNLPILAYLNMLALLSGKLTFMAPFAVLGIYAGAFGTCAFLIALRQTWLERRAQPSPHRHDP